MNGLVLGAAILCAALILLSIFTGWKLRSAFVVSGPVELRQPVMLGQVGEPLAVSAAEATLSPQPERALPPGLAPADVRVDRSKSPAVQGMQISASQPRTDFPAAGYDVPLTQQVTTYIFGDHLYEDAFTIENAHGDFLGEVGMGVHEAANWADGLNVIAFEVWLFDAASGQTDTLLLICEEAYANPTLRERFNGRGRTEAFIPGGWLRLQTDHLEALLRLVDVATKPGTPMPAVVFEQATVEAAAWHRTGQAAPAHSASAAHLNGTAAPSQVQQAALGWLTAYPGRIYLREPFSLSVHIDRPGRLSARSALAAVRKRVPQVPPPASAAEEHGAVVAEIITAPGDFHVPLPIGPIALSEGGAGHIELPLVPLRSGSLLLVLRLSQQQRRRIPGREVETLTTTDPHTGAISAVSVRKTLDEWRTESITLDQHTFIVRVKGVLGMPAIAFRGAAAGLGLGLSALFIGAGLYLGWLSTPLGWLMAALSVLIGLGVLLIGLAQA